MRLFYFVLAIVVLVLVFLPVFLGSRFFQKKGILENNAEKNGKRAMPPIDDQTKDRSYVLSLAFTKDAAQLQGSVNEANERSIQIERKGEVHLMGIDSESVIECREKYISIPGQKPIPGYMVYIDLSRYALSLRANRDVFIKQGKVLKYSDAYKKIEPGSMVSAVTKALKSTGGGTILDFILVYGCN